MTVCTLLGDRDTPDSMWKNIEAAVTLMIRNFNVDFFYIGHEGSFDEMAETILFNLCSEYPHVGYNVVLSVSSDTHFSPLEIYEKNLCPFFRHKDSSKEVVLKELNRWMIDEADYILIHTKSPLSDVSELRKYARRKNKTIIPLCCE
ncbi:MAG: hypothetical protein IJN88_08960 [Clostridia bacterium]|nr:hypothetical protein [Clostridia bacterium]